MTDKTKVTDLTRRDFVKTVGIAGLAAAGIGVNGALGAPENPHSADKANDDTPTKAGKDGGGCVYPRPGRRV